MVRTATTRRITRRRSAAIGMLAAIGVAVAAPALGQSMDDVEMKIVELGDGLAMLIGRGGNIGVSVGEDGVFLVDDQFAPLTPKIRAAVAELDPGPIRFVLNTHWHADHTGGNERLAGAGALIVAHDNVRRRLAAGQLIEAIGRDVPPAPEAALPVITFDQSVTLHLNGEAIHAFHVDPAHTDGDTIVHFQPANVIHTGDTYFSGLYPFIDKSSGGSLDGMIASADRVLAIADEETKIIPGHGPLSNRAELAAWRGMLVDVRQRIGEALAAGKTLEEVQAMKPTARWDARYGKGFLGPDDFVAIAYSTLAPAK